MFRLKTLISKLEDEDYRIRCKAVWKLRKKRDNRAVSALLRALGNRHDEDIDRRVNMYAILALADMGERSLLPTIQALQRNPEDPDDSWRRYWTTRALGYREDRQVIEPLIGVLQDDDYSVVGGAVESLIDVDDAIGLGSQKHTALENMKKGYKKLSSGDNYTTRLMKKTIEKWEKKLKNEQP